MGFKGVGEVVGGSRGELGLEAVGEVVGGSRGELGLEGVGEVVGGSRGWLEGVGGIGGSGMLESRGGWRE